MPQIIPMKDLRDTNTISEKCHATDEPVFVTKNGYGDLVVMSIETFERMTGTSLIDEAIAEAEQEIRDGADLLDARSALRDKRRKYFG